MTTALVSFPGRALAAAAAKDVRDGFASHRIWRTFGWKEIRSRYRRSLLGPFWITLTLATTIGALALIYGAIFRMALDVYLPFIATGLVVWAFFSGLIIDGCSTFRSQEWLLRNFATPLSTCVLLVLWRNLLIAAHHFVPLVLLLAAMGTPWSAKVLLFFPALLVVLAIGFWVAMLAGLGCARFRDLPQIVTSIIQLAFFVTPILWPPSMIGERAAVVEVNPFHHIVEILRAPLLGDLAAWQSWAVAGGIAVAGNAITFVVFARMRNRLVYWL